MRFFIHLIIIWIAIWTIIVVFTNKTHFTDTLEVQYFNGQTEVITLEYDDYSEDSYYLLGGDLMQGLTTIRSGVRKIRRVRK